MVLLHFLRRQFPSLRFMYHPDQSFSFVLYIVRSECHDDFSGVRHVVSESQEGESSAEWGYVRFFLVYFQTV